MYQRIWMPYVGENATTIREPGNKHDRFAVAVLEDETLCTVRHFFLNVQDLSLFASLVVQCSVSRYIGSGASFGSLLK